MKNKRWVQHWTDHFIEWWMMNEVKIVINLTLKPYPSAVARGESLPVICGWPCIYPRALYGLCCAVWQLSLSEFNSLEIFLIYSIFRQQNARYKGYRIFLVQNFIFLRRIFLENTEFGRYTYYNSTIGQRFFCTNNIILYFTRDNDNTKIQRVL